MTFGEHVFQYCERGTNAALWAEPINAISNAGFFLAALVFWQLLLWRPREQRSADHYLLMTLVFLIGLGSLSFHLFATQETELADVIPITLFMLVYLGFALNRFLGVPPGWTVLLVIGFAGLKALVGQIKCWDGGVGFPQGALDAEPCLNGSVAYLPALGALIVVGMILAERRHRAAPYVLAATVLFIGSIILRTLDLSLCDLVVIEGRDVGTHFIWHLLNALVLFLLLRASLETGTKAAAAPTPVPVAADQAEPETADSTEASLDKEAAALQEKATAPAVPSAEADDGEPHVKDAETEEEEAPQTKDAPEEKDLAKDKAPDTEGEPEAKKEVSNEPDGTDEPEVTEDAEDKEGAETKAEPDDEPKASESETKTAAMMDKAREDVLKGVTALGEASTPEEDAPAKEASESAEDSAADEAPASAEAPSPEDDPDKPTARKRRSRRRKPSTPS